MNEAMKTSSGRLQTVAIWSGYVLFFLAVLLVSLVLTFPNRQVKTWVEAQSRAAGYPRSIGELQLRGLSSVRLTNVDATVPIKKRKKKRRVKGDQSGSPASLPAEPMRVHIDQIDLSVALLAAMRKKLDLHFEIAVGDGRVEGGHVLAKGKSIDLKIDEIDALRLSDLGVGAKALVFQDKLQGELDGLLSGKIQVHWGGSHEDFHGKIDLELTEAILYDPVLNIQGGLALRDMRLGVLTAKIVIDKLGNIAILKGQSARNKATAISFAGVDIFGPDVELVAEKRSNIIIPPGKSGLRQARMQVHFAFALPESKTASAKSKDAKAKKESDRLKWSELMKFAGDKLKPFQRMGYVGMTCSGPLSHPNCVPSLPQVTVGTRRKARSDARAKKKAGKSKDTDEVIKEKKQRIEDEAKKKKAEDEAKKKAEDKDRKKVKDEDKKKKAEDKIELKTVEDRQKKKKEARQRDKIEEVEEVDRQDDGDNDEAEEQEDERPEQHLNNDEGEGDERQGDREALDEDDDRGEAQGDERGERSQRKLRQPDNGDERGDKTAGDREDEAPRKARRGRAPLRVIPRE